MKSLLKILEGNPIQKKEEEILARIKKLRIEKYITQYEMGNRLGISQNAYYKTENGYTKLDLVRLIQLSTILEVELCKLIC